MKKRWTVLLALCVLALCLTACGGGGSKTIDDPAATAQAVLDSGAFSEKLEELDADVIYDKLDMSTVTGSVVYASTGATAEELAILTCADETAAKAAAAVLQGRVDDQLEVLKSYQPNEVSKLEAAIVEQRGNQAILVVPADISAAREVIG